jgi:hypothetical protein
MLMPLKKNAAEEHVCSVQRSPQGFDHQTLTLHGTVSELNETTSQRGNNYTTFQLQDPSECAIKIFVWEHPKLRNGDCVTAEGVFETEHHEGRYTFRNELQGREVTAIPQQRCLGP